MSAFPPDTFPMYGEQIGSAVMLMSLFYIAVTTLHDRKGCGFPDQFMHMMWNLLIGLIPSVVLGTLVGCFWPALGFLSCIAGVTWFGAWFLGAN